VAILGMTTDKKSRTTGETIPSRVPEDRKVEMATVAKALSSDAKRLETLMLRELRKLPIYTLYLSRVFGLGAVVCAYLVALIDIHKAPKISNLRRFCGLAVINGRLERPTRGQKLGYCAELRTRLYQAMSSMWKNAAKKTADRPNGSTSKYLEVWRGYKARMQHSERYDATRNVLLSGRLCKSESGGSRASDISDANVGRDERAMAQEQVRHYKSECLEPSESGEHGASERTRANAISAERPSTPGGSDKGRPGARAIIHATGWHKAADVLIEDLYVVWRAIDGLPVWPSYYAAKLGFNHGGSIAVNGPRMLTVDEALALVGNPGAMPAAVPVDPEDVPEVGDDATDEDAIAAE
jgi:hypothetical protein